MAIKARFTAETLAIDDPREMPAYSIVRAAHYLRLPTATLRTWMSGRKTAVGGNKRRTKPLIELPDPKVPLLSFWNLAEAHVLGAFRREHKIPLARIRSALNYVRQEFGWKHPLLEQKFATDGVALFIEHLGKIVDASGGGQIAIREVVEAHLKRLERERQQVVRLYPFTRLAYQDSPRLVFMDKTISIRTARIKSGLPRSVSAAGSSTPRTAISGTTSSRSCLAELDLPVAHQGRFRASSLL